jgi:hypothetical protein
VIDDFSAGLIFMRRGLIALACVAACAFQLPGDNRTEAASARASLPFKWTFAHIKTGGHWTKSGSGVAFDGKSVGSLAAPLKIAPGTTFAVQAEVRILGTGPFKANVTGAGVFTRTDAKDVHTTVEGGAFLSGTKETDDQGAQLAWGEVTTGSGNAFDPGTAWHTYRLEASADQYRLFVDGRQMIQHALPDKQNPVQAGIFAAYERVIVRKFEVLPASTPPVQVPADPPLDKMVLQLSDLPAILFFYPNMEHVLSNAEVARSRGDTIAAVAQTGRVVGFEVDYSVFNPALPDLYSSVVAYKSPSDAVNDVRARVAASKKGAVAQGGVNLRAFPQQVGQVSDGYMFDAYPGGVRTIYIVLWAARGRYAGETILVDDPALLPENTAVTVVAQLATAVDNHIQANG